MYLYFIERLDSIPLNNRIYECKCQDHNKTYDVIKSNKDLNKERISNHIVDIQGRIFTKTDPRESQEILVCVEEILNKTMNELILG